MKCKFLSYIKNPYRILTFLGNRGYLKFISDISYLKIYHKSYQNKKLNLQYPKTFNEKIQWLKLYDRKDIYTVMSDKITAREFVYNLTGIPSIPIIDVYNKFSDIDFEVLPNSFVIKCSHDSGSTIICKDKKNINLTKLKRYFDKKMEFNYYWAGREWNYKNINPKIIVEQYINDESNYELKDYKLYTFNGKVKLIQVDIGRFTDHIRQFYNTNWELLDLTCDYPNSPENKILKPKKLNDMICTAEILSKNIPHLRVDLYSINDNILFGEMTFHHSGGDGNFSPKIYDRILGDWINLPNE